MHASDGRDWEAAIRSGDSSYAVILPPNYLDGTFGSPPAMRMRRPVLEPNRAGHTRSAVSKEALQRRAVERIAQRAARRGTLQPAFSASTVVESNSRAAGVGTTGASPPKRRSRRRNSAMAASRWFRRKSGQSVGEKYSSA